MVTCPVRVSASMAVDLKIEILTNTIDIFFIANKESIILYYSELKRIFLVLKRKPK